MLASMVPLPAAFVEPESVDELWFQIETLRALSEHGVLLIDGDDLEGPLFRALESALLGGAHATTRTRAAAEQVLIRLRTKRRLVAVPTKATGRTTPCALALAIAREEDADIVIAPSACGCGGACGAFGSKATTLDALFRRSMTPNGAGRGVTTRIGAGEERMSREAFARAVWRPALRYATDVRIYDRYIGRTLQDGSGNFERFASTLRWIVAEYASASRRLEPRRLRIRTELAIYDRHAKRRRGEEDLRRDRVRADAFREELRAIARRCVGEGARSPIDVTIETKLVEGIADQDESEHGRFLFTDQLALRLDPGFDILDPRSGALGRVDVEPFPGEVRLIEREYERGAFVVSGA
jgi:hypothetical protein